MNYLDELFSEENINNFKKFENEMSEECEIKYFTEKSLEDSTYEESLENVEFDEIIGLEDNARDREIKNENDRMEKAFKYKPRNIVNANRGKNSTNILYTSFLKYNASYLL